MLLQFKVVAMPTCRGKVLHPQAARRVRLLHQVRYRDGTGHGYNACFSPIGNVQCAYSLFSSCYCCW